MSAISGIEIPALTAFKAFAGSLPKHILDAYGGHPTADGMVETALEHVRILEN